MTSPILSDTALFTTIHFAAIMGPEVETQLHHSDRPSHGFAYSMSGVTEYRFTDGKTLVCEQGMLIYLPKGCSYSAKRVQRGHTACINFQLAQELTGDVPFCVPVSDPAAVERAYQLASKGWSAQQSWSTARVRASLYEIQSMLICREETAYHSSKHASGMETSVQYLHTHFLEEDISVEKLVAMTDVGESYYRRLFKSKYGTTPVRYIQNLRIQYAKQLILNSTCTVESVSQMAGFSSAAFFCRQFKQLTGLTPGAYREKMEADKK